MVNNLVVRTLPFTLLSIGLELLDQSEMFYFMVTHWVFVHLSKKGELSIFHKSMELLSYCLCEPQGTDHGKQAPGGKT